MQHLEHIKSPKDLKNLDIHELKDLADGVKAIFGALGDKKVLNEEALAVRKGFSESVVTLRSMEKGEAFKEHENVWVKRPGSGIPSYRLNEILGRKAANPLPANYLLKPQDIIDFLE